MFCHLGVVVWVSCPLWRKCTKACGLLVPNIGFTQGTMNKMLPSYGISWQATESRDELIITHVCLYHSLAWLGSSLVHKFLMRTFSLSHTYIAFLSGPSWGILLISYGNLIPKTNDIFSLYGAHWWMIPTLTMREPLQRHLVTYLHGHHNLSLWHI